MKRKFQNREEKGMRVQTLVRIRGPKDFWEVGTIFDTNDGPLPEDILAEIKAGRKTVKILEEPKPKKEDSEEENDEGRSDRPGDPGNQKAVE